MASFKLGDPVAEDVQARSRISTELAPPVILRAQPDSFVRLNTPEELRDWEEAVRATTGMRIDASRMGGSASESCSCGCSDDCCVDCPAQ
ncbi:hypothetical protein ACIG0C_30785 [Kitasatospora aureofaciens]|uniref:Uncharacterized protein n=1 Tax=Kitasatospora aureofaciens TaxID=1894 RepID=A0A1E7N9K5_KITAU|nr:hypothetical protein [Kitasatospora aureofaciens]ARF82484.1 hypothetical protein B6264_29685 [Kitasatospora aureofaciens]OEV37371.1 hypothetical protein HS99_0006215 [Kitasatospora aureofaciens]GGV00358.1 hypothetical protein GCM10010502_63530 [Kitasatospora aureofaciens]